MADEKKANTEVKDSGEVIRRSWRPANRMEVPEKFKNPRFEYYFASQNIVGNMAKKMQEGWEVDKEIAPQMKKAGFTPPTLSDGVLKDDTYTIREMILIRMPKELLQSRRDYYANKSSLAKVVGNENEQMKGGIDPHKGASTYGKIEIE